MTSQYQSKSDSPMNVDLSFELIYLQVKNQLWLLV